MLGVQDSGLNAVRERTEVKDLFKLGAAIMLTYTVTAVFFLIPIAAGHLPGDAEARKNNLAASAWITGLLTTLVPIAVSLLYPMSIYGGKRYGQLQDNWVNENTKKELSGVFRLGVLLGLPVVLICALIMFCSESILRNIFKQNTQIAEIAGGFLRVYALALLVLGVGRMPLEQMLLSVSKQKGLSVICVSTFIPGLALAYSLCLNKKINLGLPGLAYGFLAEVIATTLLLALYLNRNKDLQSFDFFKQLLRPLDAQDKKALKKLWQLGWPILSITLSQVSVPIIFNLLLSQLKNGSEALSIQSYSSFFIFFMLLIGWAQSQAGAQLVTKKIKTDPSQAFHIARYGVLAVAILQLPFCLVAGFFPQAIRLIVSDQEPAADIAEINAVLRLSAVGVWFENLVNAMVQSLRVIQHRGVVGLLPLVISSLGLWGGLLFSYDLGHDFRVPGFAAGYAISNFLSFIALLPVFIKQTRIVSDVQQSPDKRRLLSREPSVNGVIGWHNSPESTPASTPTAAPSLER